jgi:RHS repeat-associated protein
MYSEAGAQVWRGIVDGFDIDVTVSQRDLKARFPGQYDILDNGTYYNHFRTYDPSMGRYLESDPIGLGGGSNHYGYVAGSPTMFVDELGLERKPGRTSPTKWPPLPANLGGKKPKWDSEGYWKGKGGGKFTWDDRSHGAGVDRGEGEQGGHWDDEESDNRYDEDGNPLPGSPDPIPGPSEEMAACPPDGIVTTENVAVAGGVALTGYLIYRGIRMAPSLWPPFWGTIPLNLATP